jgi:hypothetical protein
VRLYHGTTEAAVASILEFGLQPRGDRPGNWDQAPSGSDRTYLTDIYAPFFATQAAAEADDESVRLAVVEVDLEVLEPDLCLPDEDYLMQKLNDFEGNMYGRAAQYRDRVDTYKHLWRDSLGELGSMAVRGGVPRAAITRVSLVDPFEPENVPWSKAAQTAQMTIWAHSDDDEQCWMFEAITKWFMGEPLKPDHEIIRVRP